MDVGSGGLRPLPQMNGLRFVGSALLTLLRRGHGAVPEGARHFVTSALTPTSWRAYAVHFGFNLQGEMPLTYFHLLAQRAYAGLMLAPGFPYSMVGMVQLGVRIQRLTALAPGLPTVVEATALAQPPSSSGARLLKLTGRIVQERALVATCESLFLAARGRGRSSQPKEPMSHGAGEERELLRYELAPDAGRRYAAVSGDYNPIHLWPWSARLLGFDRPIIQGMHTVAVVASAFERDSGGPVQQIEASFRGRIPLPSEVVLVLRQERFAVRAGERVAVQGKVEFEPARIR